MCSTGLALIQVISFPIFLLDDDNLSDLCLTLEFWKAFTCLFYASLMLYHEGNVSLLSGQTGSWGLERLHGLSKVPQLIPVQPELKLSPSVSRFSQFMNLTGAMLSLSWSGKRKPGHSGWTPWLAYEMSRASGTQSLERLVSKVLITLNVYYYP